MLSGYIGCSGEFETARRQKMGRRNDWHRSEVEFTLAGNSSDLSDISNRHKFGDLLLNNISYF